MIKDKYTATAIRAELQPGCSFCYAIPAARQLLSLVADRWSPAFFAQTRKRFVVKSTAGPRIASQRAMTWSRADEL